MKKQLGFTLIELMIVVAIVAIIAAVAYPSYQAQVLKTRRTDAHSSLMDISARLERFMAQRNTYTNEFGPGGLGLADVDSEILLSDDQFYNLTIGLNVACGGNTCPYVITATAAGVQTQDLGCNEITLSSTGIKSSNPAEGEENPAGGCW